MIEKKSWEEFRKTGLPWYVNQILHIFGWSLVFEFNKDSFECYPARVKYRGFDEKTITDNSIRLSKYMKDNSDILFSEAKEG